MARLKRLEVTGFRAFGARTQVLELDKDLAVIYAPNSHGKTSLAEALEFLLTSSTSRRALNNNNAREFADALRNVHLPADRQVSVRAVFEVSGQTHAVERVLKRDFTAQASCQGSLMVDGQPAEEIALAKLGIPIARSELAAPILMSHGLRYVLHADAVQRTAYFKSLLEVTALDELRRQLANIRVAVSPHALSTLKKYESAERHPQFGRTLASKTFRTLEAVHEALGSAIESAAGSPLDLPTGLADRLAYLRRKLVDKRRAAFPLGALQSGPAVSTKTVSAAVFEDIVRHRDLTSKIDTETAQLHALYRTLLEMPACNDVPPVHAIACPICETPNALTHARIEGLRAALRSTAAFVTARHRAQVAIETTKEWALRSARDIEATQPDVFGWNQAERVSRGYSTEGLLLLLGNDAEATVKAWQAAANRFRSEAREAASSLQVHVSAVTQLDLETADDERLSGARRALDAFETVISTINAAKARYDAAYESILARVEPVLGRTTATEGWTDLIGLAEQPEALLDAFHEQAAVTATRRDLEVALQQIDEGIADVLDTRYAQLGKDILKWWTLMRPDTGTRFMEVQRTGSGRRYLDLKVALHGADAEDEPVAVRNAVAVFSESQMGCLGLAAFLARTVKQGCRFIVLDDPFPGSDAEHRALFLDRVLPALAAEGIQTILLTHDEKVWRDTQTMYADHGIDCFQLGISDPTQGAEITRTRDDLDQMLAKATSLASVSATSPDLRRSLASTLRDACERLCKMVVIKSFADRGEAKHLSDLSCSLGDLIPMTTPFLTKNGGDPGKLRVIPGRLNSGNHDDAAPAQADLKQCLDTLRELRKRYLR